MLLLLAGAFPRAFAADVRGLPFTRSYPLEEIGDVPRGARISFDRFGRIAVIYAGYYAVLNDSVWLDLAEKDDRQSINMAIVIQGFDDRAYYGALGSWGIAETAPNGKLRARPLVPADAPRWAAATSFNHVLATREGIYFAGWNGVVFWNTATQTHHFFPLTAVATLFTVGDTAFVSCHGQPLQRIDWRANQIQPLEDTAIGGVAVDLATPLDSTRTLISNRAGRMFVFDGQHATAWAPQQHHQLNGRVTGLQQLVDGGTAVAISGKGLYLFSAEGELTTSLTSPQYQHITALAAREPGVLWAVNDDAIEKVLYGGPLTVFGPSLGLSVNWPIVVRWNNRTIVASSGELYTATPAAKGAASQFDLWKKRLPAGAWAIAAKGSRMLLGNVTGIYAAEPDGGFSLVSTTKDVVHLVMVGDDLCYAIGETEIGVLRWTDGRWEECAPRITGVGFPTVVHAAQRSAWIELGANRVARVALKDGTLQLRTFEDFPWQEPRWVNVGVVDDTVVLSGPAGRRIFFDETTEETRDAPELRQLLERSPRWINRIQKDETGTLWATHNQGVVTFTPSENGYEMDVSTFKLINASFPMVHVLPGNDVWFSAGRSLYRVERRHGLVAPPARPPVLVSVLDGRTNEDLAATPSAALQLPFTHNNLSFRFFSGSYAWHRAPLYEFRLNDASPWAPLASGSLLSFPELREGDYRLEIRVADPRPTERAVATFPFEILPPWQRTWPAYGLYALISAAAVLGIVHWAGLRARHRNLALEHVVEERTRELKATMEKLNAETRHAATLAERDRLAGEIHDSLQQGLSGLILQLDATLKLPSVAGDLRSRLNVARNMVSFTRHEVQHAVWDMESPLLEGTELDDALRKLTALINSGSAAIDIDVSGAPIQLPSAIKHHLLRIAQEAITNAVRHASATQISIQLDYQPHAVSLAVMDDGVGFHPDDVLSKNIGHFGLRGLRTRVNKLQGDLLVQSSPGQGTLIRVRVPLVETHSLPAHASASAN